MSSISKRSVAVQPGPRAIEKSANRVFRDLYANTIEVYALDTKLDVEPAANEQDPRVNVLKAMQDHVRDKAAYVG